MDQQTGPIDVGPAGDRLPPGLPDRLAIYYVHPLLAGPVETWPALVDRVAALGFTHLLFAPPFSGSSVLLPDDLDHIHPALGWSGDAAGALDRLNDACRARGLKWMLDVVLDRVAPQGALFSSAPGLFTVSGSDAIDPRQGEPAALSRFDDQASRDALRALWTARIRQWTGLGASGFRLLGLAATPPAFVAALAAATRNATAGPFFMGWLEAIHTPALGHWRGAGLDAASVSTQGWDYESGWFWERQEAVRGIGSVIVAVEEPFGPRLATQTPTRALLPPLLRRAAGFAAAFGDGWMLPMGFEHGAEVAMDPRRSRPADLPDETTAFAEILGAAQAGSARAGTPKPAASPGARVMAFGRHGETGGMVTVVNTDLSRPNAFALTMAADKEAGTLAPGEAREIALRPVSPIRQARQPHTETATRAARIARAAIEAVSPAVDEGRFPVKRIAGETVAVRADLICDGHDQIAAALQWRAADERDWQEVRMTPLGNDRWEGRFSIPRVGGWVYRVQTWRDGFATFREGLAKKVAAGVDVRLELIEGRNLIAETGERGGELKWLVGSFDGQDQQTQIAALLSPETAALMQRADRRPLSATSAEFPIYADRPAAAFASWYEIFPRSMSDDPERHGTFADVIRHLPRIRDMGFDVLYFPPIHPIGHTNRKGRNNALRAGENDPGSPYAIGSEDGGHDAIHPELGTLADFQRLRAAAVTHGLELAIDFAIQCSPDHPWLRDHKTWFEWRPDGSLRYAENPPKKYEDIVNVDFYGPGAVPELWVALCDVVLFWARQGIRIFRVDNPHTKPLPFWEWLIAEVRAAFPDAIFLAEAFTRPKVMSRLGKLGFTQSYTYFTWRNTKRELTDYLTQLNEPPASDFFRPNFFVNTPDINPPFLQTSGRPGFLIRASLAATLSGSWGVYAGFELCEGTPVPGREEYLDSEKYQIRAWDWDRPGNIVAEIGRLNRVRRRNAALQTHLGLTFLPADNDNVLFYEKATPGRDNVVLIAVSLDPANPQSAAVELPLWRWSLPDHAGLACEDLLRDATFTLTGKWQRVFLSPDAPYSMWRVRPAS